MTDRYERIRAALSMGPTPVSWAQNIDEDAAYAMFCCRSAAEAAFVTACDPDTIRELLAERDALLDALRQITEWPDGGNSYGQENIKRFAQAAIDAAMRKENSND